MSRATPRNVNEFLPAVIEGVMKRCSNGKLPSVATFTSSTKKSTLRTCTSSLTFAVTRSLLVQGLSYALIMGLIGGLLPAIKAARLPIATALREL